MLLRSLLIVRRADMCQRLRRKCRSDLSRCLEAQDRSSPKDEHNHDTIRVDEPVDRRRPLAPPTSCSRTHRRPDDSDGFRIKTSYLHLRTLQTPKPLQNMVFNRYIVNISFCMAGASLSEVFEALWN